MQIKNKFDLKKAAVNPQMARKKGRKGLRIKFRNLSLSGSAVGISKFCSPNRL